MKKIVLLLIGFVFCATPLFGKNLTKEYAKMIARYDIPTSVVESANDEGFWNGGFYTDESDHPATKYRIDLLNFLDVGNEP